MLAWTAQRLKAVVGGLDYSEDGMRSARALFQRMNIDADLRCEDMFATTFAPASFDVVFSAGVIEHFDDARPIVQSHVELVKPGGVAMIAIPNYGGWFGRVQGRLHPDNLAIHNTSIMNPPSLAGLAPDGSSTTAFPWGRFSPGLWSLNRLRPSVLAPILTHLGNLAGLLQPFDVAALCPLLVLEIRKQ
jgi:2-polyprenyl-3-methyl-5-hydroxy-6-metoxy-1,4-benzoquinol methylase